MSDYWEDCVSEALEDAKLVATKEQIDTLASWVESAHEHFGMAHGYDAIPNPMESEVARLKREIVRLEEKHEHQLFGIRKGVARRRNVDSADVHISPDGKVTFDL